MTKTDTCKAWKHPDRPAWDYGQPMLGSRLCSLIPSHSGDHVEGEPVAPPAKVEVSTTMRQQATAAGVPVETSSAPAQPQEPAPTTSEEPPQPPSAPPSSPTPDAQAPETTTAITTATKPRDPVPFHPRDTAEMFRLAGFLSNSDLIPYALRRKPNDILVVLLKGQDLGLTPMQSMSGINVIEGRAEVGALMMVSMIMRSGLCEFFTLVESTDTFATYETKRRGNPKPTTFTYTVEEAKAAGLLDKGKDERARERSPWRTQRRTMLRRRCQSMLAREVFPDICAGLYDHDELQEMRDLERGLIRAEVDAVRAGFRVVDDVPKWAGGDAEDPSAPTPSGMPEVLDLASDQAPVTNSAASAAPDALEPTLRRLDPAMRDPMKERLRGRKAAVAEQVGLPIDSDKTPRDR